MMGSDMVERGDKSNVANVNYQFFLHYAMSLRDAGSLRILDYGCGKGTVIGLLRDAGLDCYGAETFYFKDDVETMEGPLFREGFIREIGDDFKIPFEDEFFDVVISNQVLEHVVEKEVLMEELNRVLKPGGVMRHHFPLRNCLWEGHLGVPLTHRYDPGRFRFFQTLFFAKLGLGYHRRKDEPAREWTVRMLDYMDDFTSYGWWREWRLLMERYFSISFHERDYFVFRGARSNGLVRLALRFKFLYPVYEMLFRRAAFSVIELRKK